MNLPSRCRFKPQTASAQTELEEDLGSFQTESETIQFLQQKAGTALSCPCWGTFRADAAPRLYCFSFHVSFHKWDVVTQKCGLQRRGDASLCPRERKRQLCTDRKAFSTCDFRIYNCKRAEQRPIPNFSSLCLLWTRVRRDVPGCHRQRQDKNMTSPSTNVGRGDKCLSVRASNAADAALKQEI